MNDTKKSMQLRLPEDLDKWFTEEAKKMGVAKHAMMVMALQDVRAERTAQANG